jgi:serine O-acetyltransferase
VERADPVSGTRELVALIRSDIEASVHPNFRLYGNARFWARALAKLLVGPNLRAVVIFRIAHALATRGLMPVALWLRGRSLRRSGAEIHPLAQIGPGLLVVHSSGVVIGPNSVIGARARIHQGVTIGEPLHTGGGNWAGAKVGDDVMIGAHAVLLGDVTVGDRAVIGANAVVTKDVAADTTVGGIPARRI